MVTQPPYSLSPEIPKVLPGQDHQNRKRGISGSKQQAKPCSWAKCCGAGNLPLTPSSPYGCPLSTHAVPGLAARLFFRSHAATRPYSRQVTPAEPGTVGTSPSTTVLNNSSHHAPKDSHHVFPDRIRPQPCLNLGGKLPLPLAAQGSQPQLQQPARPIFHP